MAKKKNNNDPCEKFGIAITDYILGEEMDITPAELFNHVANCEHCRKDLLNWRNTYAEMNNQAYLKRPEVQEKYQKMLESIKKGEPWLPADVAKSGQKADRDKEIGTPAGALWNIIAREKIIRVADIPKKMDKYDIDQSLGAYGWLANERKVEIIYHDIGKCVKLTKDEEAKIPYATDGGAGANP